MIVGAGRSMAGPRSLVKPRSRPVYLLDGRLRLDLYCTRTYAYYLMRTRRDAETNDSVIRDRLARGATVAPRFAGREIHPTEIRFHCPRLSAVRRTNARRSLPGGLRPTIRHGSHQHEVHPCADSSVSVFRPCWRSPCWASNQPTPQQAGTITGRVTDSATGTPVPSARVEAVTARRPGRRGGDYRQRGPVSPYSNSSPGPTPSSSRSSATRRSGSRGPRRPRPEQRAGRQPCGAAFQLNPDHCFGLAAPGEGLDAPASVPPSTRPHRRERPTDLAADHLRNVLRHRHRDCRRPVEHVVARGFNNVSLGRAPRADRQPHRGHPVAPRQPPPLRPGQ